MLDPDLLAEIAGAILGWNTGLLVTWLTWPLVHKACAPLISERRPAYGLLAMVIVSTGVLMIASAPRWQALRQVAFVTWWQTAGLTYAVALIWVIPAIAGRAAELENLTRFAFRVRSGFLLIAKASSVAILAIAVAQGLNLLNILAIVASVGSFFLRASSTKPTEA